MADTEEVHYERERSRSRDRGDTYNEDSRGPGSVGSQEDAGDNRRDRNDNHGGRREENPDVNNLYVTNLSFQTTDESLRAAFEQFGEIYNASIIKEPVSQNSRGFGFVSFITLEDCEKALAAMHGAEVDGRNIRVEKARRNTGYQKTPGQYLGPPGLSARFTPGGRDDRPRDRGYGDDRGGYRGGRGGGGYDRERERDPRDVRERDSRGGYGGGGYMGRNDDMRYPPAYRGPPGGGYPDRGMPPGGGMYRDEGRGGFDPRYDPYARGRDGPPPRYDDRGRPPPMNMGGPPRGMPQPYYDGPNRGIPPAGGPMGPGPHMARGGRRSRSPPPVNGGDDRRGGPAGAPAGAPVYERGGPPSGGYGGGAGYYSGPPGGNAGPPRNSGRY